MSKSYRIARTWLAAVLVATLSLFGLSFSPSLANASASDMSIKDAEAAVANSKLTLAEAESRLAQISTEYAQLSDQVESMQVEIDGLADEVLEAQDAMIRGREALGSAMQHEYRNNQTSLFLSVILGSQNLSEFAQNLDYVSQIMDHQSAEVEAQKELRANLEEKSTELTQQKDQQEQALAILDQKQNEAQEVVSQMEADLEANSDALESLRRQAEEIKAPQESNPQSTPTPAPTPSSSSSTSTSQAGNSNTSSDSGWRTGVASAYGGSSDPNTPNPGTTANGSVCDDYSMGVAIPNSWPNCRSYFGRRVEIRWNGMTVTAVVNDCGGMGGGARSLDLQPGVFKAFGFSTCNAWGVRTVSYRFL